MVTIYVSSSSGARSKSGVVLTADGYVLTNNQVVTLDAARGTRPSRSVPPTAGHAHGGEVAEVDRGDPLAAVVPDLEVLEHCVGRLDVVFHRFRLSRSTRIRDGPRSRRCTEEFTACVTVMVRIPLPRGFIDAHTATGRHIVERDRYVDG